MGVQKIILYICYSMKKVLSISLTFSFLLSTLGVSVIIGYCPMKKDYSFSFTGNTSTCCCTNPDNGGCCKSHKLELKKIQDNFTASEFQVIAPSIDFITYEYPSLILLTGDQPLTAVLAYKDHQPPEPPVPFSILFRSFQV